jgi:hypothetical protein
MTWKAAQTKAEVIAAITLHANEDAAEFATVRRENYKGGHDFGETVMALKEHISSIQLEAAKLYVRREGFYESMKQVTEGVSAIRGELSGAITVLRAELRGDLQRMEQKIDSKT